MDQPITFPIALIRKEGPYYALLVIGAIAGAVIAFPLSFFTQSNLLIGACLLPFVANIRPGTRFNYSFFLLILLFGTASFIYGVRMFYFFALVFYLLWLAEIFIGRVNSLTVFLLGFMSPFFSQVSAILGFPMRLQLSQLAGTVLKWIGLDIQIEGNMMLLNGAVFTVDEACMGLNMLAISMLMGVFILAHNSSVYKKGMKLKYIILFFVICFVLNLVANLFRIIVLVLFEVLPGNPMHEIIGISCLIVYVLIPLYMLGRWMINRFGYLPKERNNTLSVPVFGRMGFALFAAIILFVGVRVNKIRNHPVVAHARVSLPGFITTEIGDGVTQMTNDVMLVYVKPIPEFFTGEHTPLLCWKGSGYVFKSIRKKWIYGQEIYFGQLVKANEKLYTAWWYSNGQVQTISQLDWRMRMLKGEAKFCLVNVTTNEETKLTQNIKMIFEGDLLKIEN